jgi:hypothetical protein
LSEEEGKRLLEIFKELNLKPDLANADSFQQWMGTVAPHQDETELESEETGPEKTEPEKTEPEKKPQESKEPKTPAHLPHHGQWPKLPNFSGNSPGKNDAKYDEWRYEVKCLISEGIHSDGAILRAIRRSTHGEPGRILMRLGPLADIPDILNKLDVIYGIVERGEALLGDFYAATQGDDEDVVAWSCRLEDILGRAKEKGHINSAGSDEMLRTKFWLGLRPSLRDASSHKFDTCKTFDDLRISLRIIEHERKERKQASSNPSSKKQAQVKAQLGSSTYSAETGQAQAPPDNAPLEELKGLVCSLTDRFSKLEERVNTSHSPSTRYEKPAPRKLSDKVPTCWRCGQVGHVKYGCRVILDHTKSDPKDKQPVSRGRGRAGRGFSPTTQ